METVYSPKFSIEHITLNNSLSPIHHPYGYLRTCGVAVEIGCRRVGWLTMLRRKSTAAPGPQSPCGLLNVETGSCPAGRPSQPVPDPCRISTGLCK
ncbi:hypothetical protein LX32DRAFT_369214 [Colletotrichum zoysiae]|uniref:Uncharacterized protein n=1 Tax=Colletotrichum zoysiae TaxID=1216348 RepID=A0AAD9HSR7_9PEZI|nr:hypothetical protein LX32DRAFT_369214 [Colletotrichum zoysiae]